MEVNRNLVNLVLRNGRVIDPAMGLDAVADVLIENGIIIEISPHIEIGPDRLNQLEQIDANGKWIVPGLIDMHVHLREPGKNTKRPSPRERWPQRQEGSLRLPVCLTHTR